MFPKAGKTFASGVFLTYSDNKTFLGKTGSHYGRRFLGTNGKAILPEVDIFF